MADQDKDWTNPSTDRGARPSGSDSDFRVGTQLQGGADTTSSGVAGLSSGAGSSGGVDDTAMGTNLGSGASSTRLGSASDMTEAGRRMAEEAKIHAQQKIHQATDLARDKMNQATAMAKDKMNQATEQGKSMLDQRKDSAAQQVDSAAHAFRTTAQQLHGEGQQQTGRYVDMVAQQLESFGNHLRQKDMDTLIRDAENLGRRSPITFFAGAVAAGFLLSRFLKSSSHHSHHQSDSQYDDQRHAGSYPGGSSYDTMTDAYDGFASSGIDSGISDSALDGRAGIRGTDRSMMSSSGMSDSVTGSSTTGSAGTAIGEDTSGIADDTTLPTSSSPSQPGGNTYGNR